MTGETQKTDKRELIFDAAEALFSKHGYDGVTLRAIAKQAGVDVALAGAPLSCSDSDNTAAFSASLHWFRSICTPPAFGK